MKPIRPITSMLTIVVVSLLPILLISQIDSHSASYSFTSPSRRSRSRSRSYSSINHLRHQNVLLEDDHKVALIKRPTYCDRLAGLTPRQKNECKKDPDLMEAIAYGVYMAVGECRHRLKNNPWNCSEITDRNIFKRIRKDSTREMAFLQGLLTASLGHAITKACSAGVSAKCGCVTPEEPYRFRSENIPLAKFPDYYRIDNAWKGCSDNYNYGAAIAKQLTQRPIRNRKKILTNTPDEILIRLGKETRAERNRRHSKKIDKEYVCIHNQNVGQRALIRNRNKTCKCHGVSGTCTTQTCWEQLPDFKTVGDDLEYKYKRATKVEHTDAIPIRLYTRSTPIEQKLSDKDLVYIDETPDHCLTPNITRDRQCDEKSSGVDGCEHLCCGRGHILRWITSSTKCRCKFTWCCNVTCETCKKRNLVSLCK